METSPQADETSQRVADNVKRLRRGRYSLSELATELARIGQPIGRSALGKIETGDRRVDVSELVALAVVLGVHPAALLLPPVDADESVAITPAVVAPAWAAWQWVHGQYPLPTGAAAEGFNSTDEMADFHRRSLPPTMRRHQDVPAVRSAQRLASRVLRMAASDDPEARRLRRRSVDVELGHLQRELDLLDDEAGR